MAKTRIFIDGINYYSGLFDSKLNTDYVRQFEYVNDQTESNISYFHKIDITSTLLKKNISNTLFHVNTKYKFRQGIRSGYCVDNQLSLGVHNKNCLLTTLDMCDSNNIIQTGLGHTPNKCISKQPGYHLKELNKNNSFHNKVYWSGSITHSDRNVLLDFYTNNITDNRFLIQEFIPPSGNKSISRVPISSLIHDKHIMRLVNSDIVYIIRGDRPMTHSMLEVFRAGCIPVFINISDLGWEHVLSRKNDFMLSFTLDLKNHSFNSIHEQVATLLEDRQRVMHMKNNIKKLYNTFFANYDGDPWFPFHFSKLIDLSRSQFNITNQSQKLINDETLKLFSLDFKV